MSIQATYLKIIEVEKEGYQAHELKIEVAAEEIVVLMFDPVEKGISSTFPAEDRIVILD